ncbi:Protein of unknown function [Jatrophihabitans endophyticus]|uniref:DUF4232 domain-containing protein n=1 Tax=Jatrophihabitans endophyticus TaxID=1206085 RepID=A0A1M5H827_9ACTN|nr:DUF4232 domain-containing protein [Jatrophihabitans endophyticus]SHG12043.1 Protein of unknown function [Jatrophihabitans endophyticus]
MSRIAVLAALAALTTAVTACSSSGGGGSPSTPAGPSATASSTATSTATRTATRTATATETRTAERSSTADAGPARCLEKQLRATVDPRHLPGNGTSTAPGRDRNGVLVDLENKSSTTCTLFGYPGAAIEDGDGTQVQQAKRTLRGPLGGLPSSRTAPGTVTLQPGEFAAALVEGHSTYQHGAAQAGCKGPRHPRILVTPPDTETAVPFTVGWPQCFTFEVHPVQKLASPPK